MERPRDRRPSKIEKRVTISLSDVDSKALDSLTSYQESSITVAIRNALRRDLIIANAIKKGDTPALIGSDGTIRELVIVDFEHLRPSEEKKK